jgi:hypothetical protein
MELVVQKARQVFQKWGKMGGKKRAHNLSPSRRKLIAQRAASIRWGSQPQKDNKQFMPSVRLNKPSWKSPVYLEEVLAYGSLSDWRELYRIITDHPFGAETEALEIVLRETKIYGTSVLWRGILNHLRGCFV